jgi:GDP-L-fucose synthase
MAGSAITRLLQAEGHQHLLTVGRSELDLTDGPAVARWFADQRPDVVVLAAAKVGGILANATYPADFLLDNLKIQQNVIESAWRHGTRRLLFLGSSCIYPKLADQPIREDALLGGPLEPTNEWYAIAKITGIQLCRALRQQYGFDAISLMPTNLYGPGDNYHPTNSHVLPGLIRRFQEARETGSEEVVCWGSGRPLREFLHVDDLAAAAGKYQGSIGLDRDLPRGIGPARDIDRPQLCRRPLPATTAQTRHDQRQHIATGKPPRLEPLDQRQQAIFRQGRL